LTGDRGSHFHTKAQLYLMFYWLLSRRTNEIT